MISRNQGFHIKTTSNDYEDSFTDSEVELNPKFTQRIKSSTSRIISFNESFSFLRPTTPTKKSLERLIDFLTTNKTIFNQYNSNSQKFAKYPNSLFNSTFYNVSPIKLNNINTNDNSYDNNGYNRNPCHSPKSPMRKINTDFDFEVYKSTLKSFEELTLDILTTTKNNELKKILRDYGWKVNKFRPLFSNSNSFFDSENLLQDLSNLYLKGKSLLFNNNILCDQTDISSRNLNQLVSFCPDLLIDYLKDNISNFQFYNKNYLKEENPSSVEVRSISFNGACMLADISGFSSFSSAMCSNGVSGLDALREVTNGFLGHFIKTVYQFDGDVIAFAGDAILCVFLDKPKDIITNKNNNHNYNFFGDSIEDNLLNTDGSLRAIRCGSILKTYKTESLATHIAISYGTMKIALLGGVRGQWIYVLNGPCIPELSQCISDAGPQEVVVTSDCYNQVNKDWITGIKIESKITESENYLILSIETARKCRPSSIGRVDLIESINNHSTLSEDSPPNLIKIVSQFIPKPILDAVSIESLDHIGELRQITTMFLSLDSYSPIDNQDPCTLQPFFLIAQEILQESGGYLRQFLVDDKGCVLIVMWGIPSYTHSNNCSRALFCAVSICKKSKEVGHRCSVGVTTGNVFCGMVGAPERRDYAGIGSDVNMAARLMAKARERILIDQNTYDNLSQDTKELFTQAEEMKLKGSDYLVSPFAYSSETVPNISSVDELVGFNTILRSRFKASLLEQLNILINDTTSEIDNDSFVGGVYCTVIEGMPGSGKSTAAQYFRHMAKKSDVYCTLIQARPDFQSSPYSTLKMLFTSLLGLDESYNSLTHRTIIEDLVDQGYPDLHQSLRSDAVYAVESILMYSSNDLDLNELPQAISIKSVKHSRTYANERNNRRSFRKSTTSQLKVNELVFHKVLCALLYNIGPSVIIIENAQFCDELSWNELYRLLKETTIRLSIMVTVCSTNNKPFKSWYQNKRASSSNKCFDKSFGSFLGSIELDEKSVYQISQTTNIPMYNIGTLSSSNSVSKYGRNFIPSTSFQSILNHSNCNILEMVLLDEDEVRSILQHDLEIDSIADHVVQLVHDASSGNAFWCKSISKYIKERGITELESTISKLENTSNSLHALILLRVEQLSKEQQLVLKYASIIGSEFTDTMLSSILPSQLKNHLYESLVSLCEYTLMYCIEELSDITVFGFQNELILKTIYELIPPSDASLIHLSVAETIEITYGNNLRPFYASLGYHYKKSPIDKRDLAFHYELKAADLSIGNGAFSDGLLFIESAVQLTQKKEDYENILDLIYQTLLDLNVSDSSRYLSEGPSNSLDDKNKYFRDAFEDLKTTLELKLFITQSNNCNENIESSSTSTLKSAELLNHSSVKNDNTSFNNCCIIS